MGITVHWKGSVKDRDTALKVITYARFFAETLDWKVQTLLENGYVVMEKVITEKETYEFESFVESEFADRFDKNYMKRSSKFGVIIDPNVKDTIRTENIEISFYTYRGRYTMKGFTKTQVFNENEVGNLVVHSILVLMLLTIKNTWVPNLEIYDEGDYYIPLDHKEWEEWVNGFVEEYRDTVRSLRPFNYEHLIEEHSSLSMMIGALKSKLEEVFGKGRVESPSERPYDSGR
ncbi:MAG: hypothetical protein ACP5KL_03940 [Thermoplasmata archaeon]